MEYRFQILHFTGEPRKAGVKMKHPASQHLYSYWNKLRGERSAPERSDVDPAAIRSILADTMIVEVGSPAPDGSTPFPLRLSGTRINALFDTDLRGRCFTSLWRMADRPEVAGMIHTVLDDSRPVVAGVVGGAVGREPLQFELLLLPLRHKGKTHSRLLGALSPSGSPTWLGLYPTAPLLLGSKRMIEPESTVTRDTLGESRPTRNATSVRRGAFVIYQGGRA